MLPLQACSPLLSENLYYIRFFVKQIRCPQFNLPEKRIQAAVIKQIAAENELFITSFLRF